MLEGHTLVAECKATFPAPYGRMIVGCTWQRPDGTYYNLYSPQFREMMAKEGHTIKEAFAYQRGDE